MQQLSGSPKQCTFCNSSHLKLSYTHKFHPFNTAHGPFDFYICSSCGSGITLPLPTPESLSALYASFDGGMSGFTRRIRSDNPLTNWYHQCVDSCIGIHGAKVTPDQGFTWIDVGAGEGEIAKIMSERFPKARGVAVDYHSRPAHLKDCLNVEWQQCDLNAFDFHKDINPHKFDLVMSITVLEHVLYPDEFIRSLTSLLNPGGSLYLTAPDMGSIAAKLMGRYWPYLIFGEHLNIPSKRGLKLLAERIVGKEQFALKNVSVQPVVLPYPLTYYLDHFGLGSLSGFFSRNILIRANTGILEMFVCLSDA